jgi:hypothetical protein
MNDISKKFCLTKTHTHARARTLAQPSAIDVDSWIGSGSNWQGMQLFNLPAWDMFSTRNWSFRNSMTAWQQNCETARRTDRAFALDARIRFWLPWSHGKHSNTDQRHIIRCENAVGIARVRESNPGGGEIWLRRMFFSLLWMLCVIKYVRMWCIIVCNLETLSIRRPWPA